MVFPYKYIESKITTREKFKMTEGHQPTHALFYLKKGSFIMELEGKQEKISAGEVMILPDYIEFRRKIIVPIEFVYIKFTSNESCPYTFPLPYGKINFRNKERINWNIETLEKIIMNDDPLAANYREHLLIDILLESYLSTQSLPHPLNNTNTSDKTVNSAIDYILDNIDKKILIKNICRFAGTNASTLNFKFKRELNMSVGQFITGERMKMAKHLLIGTTYTISEIAERCGFDNVYYFSNSFKQQTGMSPSEYLKQYIK